MSIRRRWVAGVSAAALALTGCATGDTASGAEGTRVLAAFYPLAWVAERVGGDRASVGLLTSPGVEPHDLEPTPQQVAEVAEADLVLVAAGLQPAVDDVVAQEAEGTVIDATEVVDLLGPDEAPDPHFWLDPVRMAELAPAVADGYAEHDPAHAKSYERSAARLVRQLERLDREYRHTLARCRTDTVVTSHDAFGYLADRYGLTVAPIAGIEPTSEPSPQRLAELTRLVETERVTTVFTESLVSPAGAEALASEAGVQVATLDPIEGLTDQNADEDYLTLMRANLAALERANGC